MNRNYYKELFFLLCCLTLLLVNQSSGSKERYQRKKISLAEFLYQRLHKLGIKGKRSQLLAAKQPKTGIKSGRRRPEDKINYLLQNSDKDPNLAVLRNYFHKIKSVNQAVDHNHTSTRPNGKKYNANAGFGPIVSQTENKKRRIRRKRPRSRRKIFLTVNEAFSRSEFNGREMRDLHKNYLMYVPIKASNKVQTLDNKQEKKEDEASENRRIDIAISEDEHEDSSDEYMTHFDDENDLDYEFYPQYKTNLHPSIDITDPMRYQTDFHQNFTYRYSNQNENDSETSVATLTDDVAVLDKSESKTTLLGSKYETNFENNEDKSESDTALISSRYETNFEADDTAYYNSDVEPLDKMGFLGDESLYITKFKDLNNSEIMLAKDENIETTTHQYTLYDTTTSSDTDDIKVEITTHTAVADVDDQETTTAYPGTIFDLKEKVSTVDVFSTDLITMMTTIVSEEGIDRNDPETTMSSDIGEGILEEELIADDVYEFFTTTSHSLDVSKKEFSDSETVELFTDATTVSKSTTPQTSIASVSSSIIESVPASMPTTQAVRKLSASSSISPAPTTSESIVLSNIPTAKQVQLPSESENKVENAEDGFNVKDDRSVPSNLVYIPVGHGFYYKFVLNHQNKLDISEI